MKIIFMGTPDFAAGSLRALIAAGHEITLVVTQPDREKGRGKKVQFTPVKECALEHGIDVFTPVKIKTPEAVAELKKYEADIFVVAAFGQILSQEILDMPKYGCVNVHASLLPKYRGAAPIQHSILDGETETGVTIMQMNAGLDTGDMISKVVVPIEPVDTADVLHDKLMEAGAKLLVDTLPSIENGTAVRTPQTDEGTCYASMLSKDMGRLNFTESAKLLERKVRALNSWPCAFTQVDGKNLKIWEAELSADNSGNSCGSIFAISKDSFQIQTGEGALKIKSVQLEGKKRMSVADFLRGYHLEEGTVLPS